MLPVGLPLSRRFFFRLCCGRLPGRNGLCTALAGRRLPLAVSAAAAPAGLLRSVLIRILIRFCLGGIDHLRDGPLVRCLFCLLFGLGLGFGPYEYVRRLASVLRTAARHCRKLVCLVLVQHVVTVVVQPDLDCRAQQVHLHGCPVTVLCLHKGSLLRYFLDEVFIGLLLIAQTAQQPSAASRYLGRIQRQRLHLGHLRRDRTEIIQELAAAVRPSADSEAAQHLCLVPHADLPQLDARVQHRRKILDQRAEIHAPV